MFMVFQGLAELLQVEVGVAQLAVDGAQGLQVVRARVDRRLKELHTCATVACLTQPLSFQGQLHTGAVSHGPVTGIYKTLMTSVSHGPVTGIYKTQLTSVSHGPVTGIYKTHLTSVSHGPVTGINKITLVYVINKTYLLLF